jgi:hypothetical protein
MRTYRVEHHTNRKMQILAEGVTGFPHPSTLTPYISCLLHQGATGWVVLVDALTGRRVARRRIQ